MIPESFLSDSFGIWEGTQHPAEMTGKVLCLD